MATIVSGSKDQAWQAPLQSDEEDPEYSFATVYNGPRPPYVPRAEPISIRPFSVRGVGGSHRSSSSHPTQVVPDTQQSVSGASLENSSRETPEDFPTDKSNSVTSTGYIVSEESSNPSQNQASPEAQDADADSPSLAARGISENDMFASFHLETVQALPYPGQEDHISIASDFRFSGRKSSSFHASNSSANGFSGELQDRIMLGPTSSNNQKRRKGECHECLKGHRLQEKETCLVCNAKYCISCVVKAMGSMPEGRKCVKCIGQPIDESRRPNLGKPSRLLNHLLDTLEVQQIMKAERECLANQLPPEQLCVNGNPLNAKELAELLGCSNPPSRLKPGKYWYDGECGYWGREGEKPDKIITASLHVGGKLDEKASAGCTKVYINGREITKTELKMLKFAGVQCLPNTRLWVHPDGNYQEEGQNNHLGNIWEKARSRFLYPLFSLPIPSSNTIASEPPRSVPAYLAQKKNYKILLLGHAGCGTSTIFKQAKILYEEHFTSKELQNIKLMIQRNIYKYITILLEACERFEDEENTTKMSLDETMPSTLAPSESGDAGQVKSDRKNPYTINASLKDKADLFLDIMANGHPDAYFPAATWEYALLVEEMWKDPAIQATYKRRAELHMLPDVAEDFLDRVVEISSNDYNPSHRDILHAEGLIHGSGLAEIEFCLAENSATSGAYTETFNQPFTEVRYHLIRINGDGMADGCKWLEMFEYVHAVIFCVALDAYDQMWSDGKTPLQNKMVLSRELFESIVKYPYFQNKPVVLLLNKYDSFEEKVHTVPLTRCEWFSDFDPVRSSHTTQSLAPQAYTYIAHQFKKHFEMINPTGRKLFTFQLKAWEESCVDAAFQYVKETLKWEEIQQTASLSNMHWDSRSYSTEMSSISPLRAII